MIHPFLKLVFFSVLITFSFASDCSDIRKYLKNLKISYENTYYDCKTNDKGELIKLSLYDYERLYDVTFDVFKKFLSYKTIEELAIHPLKLSKKYLDEVNTLPNLKKITIEFDSITDEINVNSFKNYPSVYIKGNSFCRLPEYIYEIKNLNGLEIWSTYIYDSEMDKISQATGLKYLSFVNSAFNESKLDAWKTLDLDTFEYIGGKISKFPSFIISMKNLRELTLIGGDVDEVPEELYNLTKLELLDLSMNDITKISEKIGNLVNLKTIKLYNNSIYKIPNTIVNLKNLEYLNLDSNKVGVIPSCLGELKNLQTISFYGNRLDCELSESLNSLPKLKRLDLRANYNIKGKTLTNESLTTCIYDSKYKDLCISKKMDCFEDDYLGLEPCDSPTDNTVTTNGRCGMNVGRCPEGKCCSIHGYCGTSKDHCGAKCVPKYGICKNSDTTTTKVSTKIKTSSRTTKKSLPTSTNGKCGSEYGVCPSNKCCSKYGYCGTNEKYCGSGCQSEFGKCSSSSSTTKKSTTTKKSSSTSTSGKCGSEYGSCPSNKCCSKYGYCGTDERYCGSGCQSKYGKCN